jgi:hypothetical protein
MSLRGVDVEIVGPEAIAAHKPDVLKMDIEGPEGVFLEALGDLSGINRIYVEFHHENIRLHIDKLASPTHCLGICSHLEARAGGSDVREESMSKYNEPWVLGWGHESLNCIEDANRQEVAKCEGTIGSHKLLLARAERIVACVNACRGIPTHILENWQGTDTEGLKPEDWLLNTVTEDGSGYVLASPAGGVMRLTSEQRERIGKALLALASEQPDAKA